MATSRTAPPPHPAPAAPEATPAGAWRRVVLFSGHMTDAPDRAAPRFPEARVPAVAGSIAAILSEWRVDGGTLAICSGARGGDILFAEAALARGAVLHLHLALPVAAFVEASVAGGAGLDWRSRFDAVRRRAARVEILAGTAGADAAAQASAGGVFARNNARMACPHRVVRFDC